MNLQDFLHGIRVENNILEEISKFLSFGLQVKFEFAIRTSGSTDGVLRFATRVCLGRQLKFYSLKGQNGGSARV